MEGDLQLAVAQVVAILEYLGDLLEAAGRRSEEAKEGLAGRKHSAEILGVELHADEPLVVLEFDNLHTLAAVILTDKAQPSLFELVDEFGVNLVTVTVSLPDLLLVSVQLPQAGPFGAGLEVSGPLAESHGASHLGLVNLRHVDDRRMLAILVELLTTSSSQPAHVASVLNNGHLHTQAHTQVRNIVRTSPLGTLDHALGTTLAKTTLNIILESIHKAYAEKNVQEPEFRWRLKPSATPCSTRLGWSPCARPPGERTRPK